jgi:hypothetical protein
VTAGSPDPAVKDRLEQQDAAAANGGVHGVLTAARRR